MSADATSTISSAATVHTRSPWWWVPSLYAAQALPFVLVNIVITYPYTRLGVSAVVIGYTSWLAIPWTIKPLWSPLVELIGTERRWVWITEYIASAAIIGVGLGYTSRHFLIWTVVAYIIVGLASATHDIAADGFYMRVLTPHEQTWFSGIRSFAFRGGWVYCDGALTMLAGLLIRWKYGAETAWSISHFAAGATLFLLATYHAFILPPQPLRDTAAQVESAGIWRGTLEMFRKFLQHIPLATALPFLLFYRFAEGQVVKFIGKFLLDPREKGGMGLLEDQLGLINGTLGIIALLAGGVLAGMLASRDGVRKWILPMTFMMNMTNFTFLLLANFQPTGLVWIAVAVIIEKFGYGLGFTSYMLYMLYISQGKHQTSFYAMCTGVMSLGLILPGNLAGYMLERLGYTGFFTWVLIATAPSFFVTWLVFRQMDPAFGKRQEAAE